MDALKIWLRQQAVNVRLRVRELVRRQLRKLIELAVTDMDLMAKFRDVTSAAEFEAAHLRDAAGFKHRIALYRFVAGQIKHSQGLHLEFGVYKGDSINRLAELVPGATWYGFDSFVGLPETWTLGAKEGAFSVKGKLPPVRDNVRLIEGFFENTLPGFVAQHRGATIALLHIDCDLYSSTKTVLSNLGDMLAPGSIIVFDELINYPGWQDDEYKAFMEFVAERNVSFEYLAYNRTGSQVAVRILDRKAPALAASKPAAEKVALSPG